MDTEANVNATETETVYVLAIGEDGAARLATVDGAAGLDAAMARLRDGEAMPLGVALLAIARRQTDGADTGA